MPFKFAFIESQYDKDPGLKSSDVQILREWVDKQPHLPTVTDLQLILFLQSCYYRIEPAKSAIDNFFTVRTLCPDIFDVNDPQVVRMTMAKEFCRILPDKTPEGYNVLWACLLDFAPSSYIQLNSVRVFDVNLQIELHGNGVSDGLLIVIDMKGSSIGHLARMNLVVQKKYLFYLQEGLPVRLKGVHLINIASFTDKAFAMVKPFLKKELIQLIHFHSDSIDGLYKDIPKKILPRDYGGEAPSIAELNEESLKTFNNSLDLMESLKKQKVDENKRPEGQKRNLNDIFGMEGTFKKLELD